SARTSRRLRMPPAAMIGSGVTRRRRRNQSRLVPRNVPSLSTYVQRKPQQYRLSSRMTSSGRRERRSRQPWTTSMLRSQSRATTIFFFPEQAEKIVHGEYAAAAANKLHRFAILKIDAGDNHGAMRTETPFSARNFFNPPMG